MVLQWAVNEVAQLEVNKSELVNILISKSVPPLPTGTKLPAGKFEVLVTTVITPEEMRWSTKNRRDSLLQKLRDAGISQISKPGRESVVR